MPKTNEKLNQLQADATVFYQKLRAYHWTVTGEGFPQLHAYFESAYDRWATHIDDVAERTVIDGGKPLVTLAEVQAKAKVKEAALPLTSRAMLEDVAADSKYLLEAVSAAIEAAESEGKRGTVNSLNALYDQEEKALWMLRATLAR